MAEMTPELREARLALSGYRADFPVKSEWVHVKSGRVYWIQAHALNESDLVPCIVYRCREVGTAWIRPAAEFADGRFVKNI